VNTATTYTAKLTEKIAALDAYPLPHHWIVNLKVRGDGKHDVTWTIWQVRKVPPAN
jgi:hypothetical protein